MTFPTIDGLRTMELGHPGPSRTFLNGCALTGNKRATAGLLSEYITEGEPWERVGERLVLVDDETKPLGVIEVTRVEETTFSRVTWAFAEAKGEGYADLAEWQQKHRGFWAKEGEHVDDETPVLCIYFNLVQREYQPSEYPPSNY